MFKVQREYGRAYEATVNTLKLTSRTFVFLTTEIRVTLWLLTLQRGLMCCLDLRPLLQLRA